MITYIYILQDPDTMDVRYVGKTTNPKKRLYQHTNKRVQEYSRRRHLCNWLLKLLNANKKPVMTVIDQTEYNWKELEIYWIELRKANKSHNEISKETGIHKSTVKRMIDKGYDYF